jgi:hypothetical protein
MTLVRKLVRPSVTGVFVGSVERVGLSENASDP